MKLRPILFALLACAAAAQPLRLPVPAGPFGIGRIGFDWVDQSRRDEYSADPKARRELMVYVWYPAAGKSVNARGAYLPGASRMDALPEVQARMQRATGGHWGEIVSGALYSHAVENAPAARNAAGFPVVVFSHGAGNSGFHYTCLIEDLVSRGYVVAAIEHTHAARAVWFPDGRVLTIGDPVPPPELSGAELAKWQGSQMSRGIDEGAADVRFVLDRLIALNGDARSPLAGRVDAQRAAAMGHSAGAEFAARACQLDARIRACVDLDGSMVPAAALPISADGAKIRQPLLFLEAYHQELEMGGLHRESVDNYLRIKEEQLEACPRGSYDVVVRSPGIAHPSFSDVPLLFAGKDGFPEMAAGLHNLDLIEGFVREFLGKVLKQEAAPRLQRNGTAAEWSVKAYGQ